MDVFRSSNGQRRPHPRKGSFTSALACDADAFLFLT